MEIPRFLLLHYKEGFWGRQKFQPLLVHFAPHPNPPRGQEENLGNRRLKPVQSQHTLKGVATQNLGRANLPRSRKGEKKIPTEASSSPPQRRREPVSAGFSLPKPSHTLRVRKLDFSNDIVLI